MRVGNEQLLLVVAPSLVPRYTCGGGITLLYVERGDDKRSPGGPWHAMASLFWGGERVHASASSTASQLLFLPVIPLRIRVMGEGRRHERESCRRRRGWQGTFTSASVKGREV